MIHLVLPAIAQELNHYLSNVFDSPEEKVEVSPILDEDGNSVVKAGNKILITLLNLEDAQVPRAQLERDDSGKELTPNTPIQVTILISTQFLSSHYNLSLKYLSGIVTFFQLKPLFNKQNTPLLSEMSNDTDIHFNMVSTTMEDLKNIFTLLGSTYTPSVVYKMRMVLPSDLAKQPKLFM
jgi:hypothetical protein